MAPMSVIHICHPGDDADAVDPDPYDEAGECEESEAASDDEVVDPEDGHEDE